MKYRVLIPDKPTVRHMVCCLESLVSQLNRIDKLDKTVTCVRMNTQIQAIEIEVAEEESRHI
jgi:Zn-dependent oligopeptidase